MAVLELDYMEYANDAAAQAAYVSSEVEVVDQEQTESTSYNILGNSADTEYRAAQGFQLSQSSLITAVVVKRWAVTSGSPTGNWTLRIETDDEGVPSGNLANANASIVVTPPAEGATVKGIFATSFTLNSATPYWIVIQCDNQARNVYWTLARTATSVYDDGYFAFSADDVWDTRVNYDLYFQVYTQVLQCYSESNIKQQGSYSLKAIASLTNSLNETLTKSGLSIDLSDKDEIKVGVYASRTGTNLQLQLINDPVSWDLLDEDCSDISDWDDLDNVNGVSEVDPAGQMRLYNTSASSSSRGSRYRDIGTYPTDGYTFEIRVYHNTLGTLANDDPFYFSTRTANILVGIICATDGLYVFDGASWNEVGTNIVDTGVWTTWRFLIDDTDDTIDIYKNGVEIATGVDCSWTGSWNTGDTHVSQEGYNTATESHIDYIRAATGLYTPASVTHTKNIVISSADTWETKTWDISAITNADKDNIDEIIIKIINADADNIFYVDNIYAQEFALDNAVLFGANF